MDNTKEIVCKVCDDTGIMEVANGPDDHDHDFCDCVKGLEVKLEAERLTAHND